MTLAGFRESEKRLNFLSKKKRGKPFSSGQLGRGGGVRSSVLKNMKPPSRKRGRTYTQLPEAIALWTAASPCWGHSTFPFFCSLSPAVVTECPVREKKKHKQLRNLRSLFCRRRRSAENFLSLSLLRPCFPKKERLKFWEKYSFFAIFKCPFFMSRRKKGGRVTVEQCEAGPPPPPPTTLKQIFNFFKTHFFFDERWQKKDGRQQRGLISIMKRMTEARRWERRLLAGR